MGDGATPDDVLKVYADFLQEVLDRAERERGPKGLEIICVCSGGPPPGRFAKRLSPLIEENFPEVLYKATFYPIPWHVRIIVNSALWFVPSKTRQKIHVLSTEDQIADLLGLAVEQLPPDLRGGIQAVGKRARPDTHAKVWKCVRELIAKGDPASENEEEEGKDVSTALHAASSNSLGATLPLKEGASSSSFFACCLCRIKGPIEGHTGTPHRQKSGKVATHVLANDLQKSESIPNQGLILLSAALVALAIFMVFGLRCI